jgi:hypothetical protein
VALTADDGGPPSTGFLWRPSGGFENLNNLVDHSWTIHNAFSINNEDQILAEASYNGGADQFVLLDPVPEPSSIMLLITATGLIAAAARRRKRTT